MISIIIVEYTSLHESTKDNVSVIFSVITVNSRIYPAGYARFYLPRTPPAGYMRVRVIYSYFYTGTNYIQDSM